MNLFQKVLYLFLSVKEKSLRLRLDKYLKRSAVNSTSKKIIDGASSLSLTSETQKNLDVVRSNMTELVKNAEFNPDFLVKHIKETGYKILFIKDIQKILKLINEEHGLILERKGFNAFILNLLTNSGIKFSSKPVFIFELSAKDFYLLLFNVYKLEGYLRKLPGYDYESQKLFRKFYKAAEKADVSQLTFEELNSLKEAVARDNEASEFVINIAKERDGAKNAALKIKDGGAEV